MKIWLLLVVFYVSFFYSCAQKHHTRQVSFIKAGDSVVQVQEDYYNAFESSICFINVHENEFTCRQATHEYLAHHQGIFIQLNHTDTGSRFIDFSYEGKFYRFDPNRIFTPAGRKITLQKLSACTPEADNIIAAFANSLLNIIGKARLIIAVHNNTDKKYSVNSYRFNKEEAFRAEKLYINPANDEDDFIITTEKKIFIEMQKAKKNVVQINSNGIDDGSLSHYCSVHHIPYINIETQDTHYEEHLEFLQLLTKSIRSYK